MARARARTPRPEKHACRRAIHHGAPSRRRAQRRSSSDSARNCFSGSTANGQLVLTCPATLHARVEPPRHRVASREGRAGALGRLVREVIAPTCALAHGTPSIGRRPKSHGAPSSIANPRQPTRSPAPSLSSVAPALVVRAAPREGRRTARKWPCRVRRRRFLTARAI
jgi:hypothetical protein